MAGITGRGTGPTPFDLGLSTDQPVGEVLNRWRALMAAEPGFPAHVFGRQVHGKEVRLQEGGEGWIQIEGVDGHVTTTPGVMLYVSAADCIPIYLVAPRHRAIGLLHAGWRGTAAGILERGINAIYQHSKAPPAEIVMHCGIGICGDCYEVESEVNDALGGTGTPSSPGHFHVDIRKALEAQANRLGVSTVSLSARCSSHDRGEFFSHRGSGGRDGRMVGYLGLLPFDSK
ncbi:MAG TPA: polyphenol oxidase family protein [Gemmatimonadales bacterium]|nr:polyphenol oxidase family protein [Gemmatimonadales bacterium]